MQEVGDHLLIIGQAEAVGIGPDTDDPLYQLRRRLPPDRGGVMDERVSGLAGEGVSREVGSRQLSACQPSGNDAHSSDLSPQPSIEDRLWVPDNPDGSGWADVDWVSAVPGSKYHYRHGEPHEEALALLPPFYRVVTRLDTELLHAPHENSYY